jgi:PleD family two-component response regulator
MNAPPCGGSPVPAARSTVSAVRPEPSTRGAGRTGQRDPGLHLEGETDYPMTQAPLVLLVTGDEWTARSLGSVLAPRGYAVLRAYTAEQALDRAAATDPDAVFIGSMLPDMSGSDLCRRLIDDGLVARSAPLVLLAPAHTSRDDKLAALKAGAWDVVQLPVDSEELLLRLERFIQGRVGGARPGGEEMIDEDTGFYTREGVLQRVREVSTAAARAGNPITCIVITTGGEAEEATALSTDQVVALADRIRRSTRQTDVLARIGASDFAVIAPDTPASGANILAHRLREQAATRPSLGGRHVRAGVYTVVDPRVVKLDPLELIRRATTASRTGEGG